MNIKKSNFSFCFHKISLAIVGFLYYNYVNEWSDLQ